MHEVSESICVYVAIVVQSFASHAPPYTEAIPIPLRFRLIIESRNPFISSGTASPNKPQFVALDILAICRGCHS